MSNPEGAAVRMHRHDVPVMVREGRQHPVGLPATHGRGFAVSDLRNNDSAECEMRYQPGLASPHLHAYPKVVRLLSSKPAFAVSGGFFFSSSPFRPPNKPPTLQFHTIRHGSFLVRASFRRSHPAYTAAADIF